MKAIYWILIAAVLILVGYYFLVMAPAASETDEDSDTYLSDTGSITLNPQDEQIPDLPAVESGLPMITVLPATLDVKPAGGGAATNINNPVT